MGIYQYIQGEDVPYAMYSIYILGLFFYHTSTKKGPYFLPPLPFLFSSLFEESNLGLSSTIVEEASIVHSKYIWRDGREGSRGALWISSFAPGPLLKNRAGKEEEERSKGPFFASSIFGTRNRRGLYSLMSPALGFVYTIRILLEEEQKARGKEKSNVYKVEQQSLLRVIASNWICSNSEHFYKTCSKPSKIRLFVK